MKLDREHAPSEPGIREVLLELQNVNSCMSRMELSVASIKSNVEESGCSL